MHLLFVDIVEPTGWSDFREGRLVARSLRFKLKWDMVYQSNPEMSRFQPGASGQFGKTGVDYETSFRRAKRLLRRLRTTRAGSAKQLADMIRAKPPTVLYLCAHGVIDGNQTRFEGHTARTKILLGHLAKKLKKTDLSSTCVVSSVCEFGSETAIKQLKRVGFGTVIGWPKCTCMTETSAFNTDFFEALAFQYVLTLEDAEDALLPTWVKRAFSYASANLKSRYGNCDEVFGKPLGAKGNAGYYLHTRPWKRDYGARPVLWTNARGK